MIGRNICININTYSVIKQPIGNTIVGLNCINYKLTNENIGLSKSFFDNENQVSS